MKGFARCEYCDFVAKSNGGIQAHVRFMHSEHVEKKKIANLKNLPTREEVLEDRALRVAQIKDELREKLKGPIPDYLNLEVLPDIVDLQGPGVIDQIVKTVRDETEWRNSKEAELYED